MHHNCDAVCSFPTSSIKL